MSKLSNSLVKASLSALYHTGVGRMLAPWTQGVGAILMLHQVNPAPLLAFEPNRILRITPEFLEIVVRQCIEAGLELVSLDEMRERLLNPCTQRRFVCITLDDAYRDNIEHAIPVLRRYGVPYTIYAPIDYIDGHGELWWLALENVLRVRSAISLTCGDRTFSFPLHTADQKDRAFKELYWYLRTLDEQQSRKIVRDLCAEDGICLDEMCRRLIMSWDELRQVAADPLATIGAHTCRHVALAHLSEHDAQAQIELSIKRLEAELGRPCRHFSYPYGDAKAAGRRDFDIAARVGVSTAVTTRKGLLRAEHRDALTSLPRLSINGDFQDPKYLKVLLDGAPFAALTAVSRVRSSFAPSTTSAAR
jgi:peptidoglycan/xylan/chitin deacetylase (PgdA/CDA1 family)